MFFLNLTFLSTLFSPCSWNFPNNTYLEKSSENNCDNGRMSATPNTSGISGFDWHVYSCKHWEDAVRELLRCFDCNQALHLISGALKLTTNSCQEHDTWLLFNWSCARCQVVLFWRGKGESGAPGSQYSVTATEQTSKELNNTEGQQWQLRRTESSIVEPL